VAIGFLLLVSLVVSAVLSYVGLAFGGGEVLMFALEFVASMALMTVLFAAEFTREYAHSHGTRSPPGTR
jgi:hypothetical protein